MIHQHLYKFTILSSNKIFKIQLELYKNTVKYSIINGTLDRRDCMVTRQGLA